MRSSELRFIAYVITTLMLGCVSQDAVAPGGETDVDDILQPPRGSNSWMKRRLPTLATVGTDTTFKARWDGWISRGMNTGGCADSSYSVPDTVCQVVQVGRWSDATCCDNEGRTFGVWDFNTSMIPDDAIILNVSFTVHVENVYTKTQYTPPGVVVSCTLPLDWEISATGLRLQVGLSWLAVTSIGQVIPDSVPYAFVTECTHTDTPGNYLGDLKGGDSGTYVNAAMYVNKSGPTRIKIDSEVALLNTYTLFSLYSKRHPINKPAELNVIWRSAYELYGATLGDPHWAGFDTLLAPDLGSSLTYERLDETLPVFLVYTCSDSTGGLPQKLSEPVRINSTSWWGTAGFRAQDFADSVYYDPPIDQEYHTCPQGQGLEEVTLNEDGTLTVKDLNFGGVGSRVRIELRSTDPDPQKSMVRVIALQWDNPGSFTDVERGPVDAAPDGIHRSIVTLAHNVVLQTGISFPVWLPTRVVEWVSTDISGLEPIRKVDSVDLAALSLELGRPVRWGFGGESGNYHVNVAMFSSSALYIDSADLAMMAADINSDDCTLAKTLQSDKDKILAWFGIAATGNLIKSDPMESRRRSM